MDHSNEKEPEFPCAGEIFGTKSKKKNKSSKRKRKERSKDDKISNDSGDNEDDLDEKKRLLANCQERKRMQRLNKALEKLRSVLPPQFQLYHRRMSKIRTLRVAMNYIATLTEMLAEHSQEKKQDAEITVVKQPETPQKFLAYPYMHVCSVPFTPIYPTQPFYTGVPGWNSCYETPVRSSQPNLNINPRHLDFFASPQLHERADFSPIESTVTTPSRGTISAFTPQHGMKLRVETITSPMEQRNRGELNTSFLSSHSDNMREDHDDIQPLQSLEDYMRDDFSTNGHSRVPVTGTTPMHQRYPLMSRHLTQYQH
ncbi:hypothetical protein CHS0354_023467 [Potamilus streckersoni]|uniref:BHLH domain-containing protein n=1 Tax=Potamilus streckersoni TaxID=2493646 RepID=A0AAE0VPY3_9BIVA|nr:hypothetical protein CHS0354_023467 [Potamilus streckersoni]